MPELRRDPIVGRWVIIATERARRPSDLAARPPPAQPTLCPFCAGNEDKTPSEVYVAGRSPSASPNSPGWKVRAVGQGYASLSAPMKEMLRLTKVGRFHNGGNPVARWMLDNLAVAMDPAGNVKPDKATAADKIDGISAAATAMRECMDAELAEAAPPVGTAAPVPVANQRELWRPTQRLKI